MNYNTFIKKMAEECNDNGVRITQPKLKKLFEVMADVIAESFEDEEEERIKIRGFLTFYVDYIPPKKLPNGEFSEPQYTVKIKLSEGYKKKLKEKVNKKD